MRERDLFILPRGSGEGTARSAVEGARLHRSFCNQNEASAQTTPSTAQLRGPPPPFSRGGKNHSHSRGAKSARVLQALCILLVTTGLDPVVHAEMQLQKPAESPNQLRRRMDCRIKSGNDERKKRKRNAGRRSISCPARKRRAGRATERRLAPPSACGRARLPAFHHGSRQRDFVAQGSASGQASRDLAADKRRGYPRRRLAPVTAMHLARRS